MTEGHWLLCAFCHGFHESVSLQKPQPYRTVTGSIQIVCSSGITIINLVVVTRLLLYNYNPIFNIFGKVTGPSLTYTYCIESYNSVTK